LHPSTNNHAVATKDILQHTTIFSIPRDFIINVQTSELPKKLPDIFDPPVPDNEDEEHEPLDSWASLILVMLYEYLQGEASKWKPYMDVLPQTFDTPIFWSETELEELKGTCLTTEKIGKQESDEMLRTRILPIVLQNPEIFYPEGVEQFSEHELLMLAHRMGSTIMAYAFDLEPEGEQDEDEEEGWVEDRDGKTLLGMVPMADIMNANAEFNVRNLLSCVDSLLTKRSNRHTSTTPTVSKSHRSAPAYQPAHRSSTTTARFRRLSYCVDMAT
jgi:SET domain-containing protein 6